MLLHHHQRKAANERKTEKGTYRRYVSMLRSLTSASYFFRDHGLSFTCSTSHSLAFMLFRLTSMDAHSLTDSPRSWTGPTFVKSPLLLISVLPPHTFRRAATRIRIRWLSIAFWACTGFVLLFRRLAVTDLRFGVHLPVWRSRVEMNRRERNCL